MGNFYASKMEMGSNKYMWKMASDQCIITRKGGDREKKKKGESENNRLLGPCWINQTIRFIMRVRRAKCQVVAKHHANVSLLPSEERAHELILMRRNKKKIIIISTSSSDNNTEKKSLVSFPFTNLMQITFSISRYHPPRVGKRGAYSTVSNRSL